jgi:hypothetical protein
LKRTQQNTKKPDFKMQVYELNRKTAHLAQTKNRVTGFSSVINSLKSSKVATNLIRAATVRERDTGPGVVGCGYAAVRAGCQPGEKSAPSDLRP